MNLEMVSSERRSRRGGHALAGCRVAFVMRRFIECLLELYPPPVLKDNDWRGFTRTARITSLFNVHCSIVWNSRRRKDLIGTLHDRRRFLSRVYDRLLCLGVSMEARKGRGNRSRRCGGKRGGSLRKNRGRGDVWEIEGEVVKMEGLTLYPVLLDSPILASQRWNRMKLRWYFCDVETFLHLFYLSNSWEFDPGIRIDSSENFETFLNIESLANFSNGPASKMMIEKRWIEWNQIGPDQTETIKPTRQVSNPDKPNLRYVLILFIIVTSTTFLQ